MAKYAKLNTEKTDVIKLFIANEEDINSGIFGNPELFIDVTDLDYVSIGSTYDEETDTFKPLKPFVSWIFDEETNEWVAPIEKPEGFYFWKEELQSWEVLE